MRHDYLEFEKPLADLDLKIDELRKLDQETSDVATDQLDENSVAAVTNGDVAASDRDAPEAGLQPAEKADRPKISLNITDEISRLAEKSQALVREIYRDLTPWQIAQVARHPKRPYLLDYVEIIFDQFKELKGDRSFADDPAILGGLAVFEGQPVMIVGHQKGRTVPEKVKRNFGMPRPEGYRKALRLMKLAERFQVPILTFIDTPGAFPGIDAEERGQSEAIAMNIQEMSALTVPVITTILGEGGSGGALAIGVCDHLQMLQYSTYSVISPEGCASILWKSADKAQDAASAMGLTADRLQALKLVDDVIEEPCGGAHRDYALIASRLKQAISTKLSDLMDQDTESLLDRRYNRLMEYSALV